MKRTFPLFFLFLLGWMACDTDSSPEAPRNQPATSDMEKTTEATTTSHRYILFFGNSLTAAYGLDPSEGFVGAIQERLDSLDLPYKTVNAGLSGETTAGGNSRVDWILEQQRDLAIFVLELGGNDGLRGINPEDSYKNLQSIIDKVKSKDPNIQILLAGMEAPPNMGPEFTAQFRSNYRRLAKTNNLPLIPFLLEGVGGVPELNLEDGIHPTAEGHKIVAENIWKVLEGML